MMLNYCQELDSSAQAAEAPWREKNDTLIRHGNERKNAEKEASDQVHLYRTTLNELEGKHRACQTYV